LSTPAPTVIATCATLICCAGVTPGTAAEPETPVIAQDLEQVRSSGRVLSSQWTRRANAYTLQIVFPDPLGHLLKPGERSVSRVRTASEASREADGPASTIAISTHEQIAETQVWLLATDGSVINPMSVTGKSESVRSRALKIASLRYLGETPVEVQYSFPLSASENAIAVVVMLDGKLYTDRLVPLEGDSR
jgi:hypothetical protein